jgi:hypothetical protein
MALRVNSMKTMLLGIATIFAVLVARNTLAVGVAYSDPAGGWTYAFLGNSASPGSGVVGDTFDALDGTWDRLNGSDSWDASAIGGTINETNAPGGVSALTSGGTDFIRLQDPGDGRDHGFPDVADSAGSNRKIYLGHDIGADTGVQNPGSILQGVTLSFRARVATAATGILDGQYPDAPGGENGAEPPETPWPAGGSGLLGHDGGKGSFGIRELDTGQNISFSLSLASDWFSDGTPFGMTGLTMNSLESNVPSATIDPYQNEATLNVVPVADLTTFHEFWITIQPDDTGVGTHKVDVYVDGSTTASSFLVTAGTGSDYALSYLALGLGATPQQGAIDVDFYAYKEGIHVPSAPAQASGDYNDDGTVNAADYVLWRNGGPLQNDPTAGVTPEDYTTWRANFGKTGGSSSAVSTAAVPEPATLSVLLLTVTVGSLAVRRGRN